MSYINLVADAGGTHIRFALATPQGLNLTTLRAYRVADYPTIVEAIHAYGQDVSLDGLSAAAFAVAATLEGDEVKLTNADWAFSKQGLSESLGGIPVTLLNDWQAIGWAAAVLKPADLEFLTGTTEPKGAMKVFTGPGTGLGTCIVHHDQATGRTDVIPSEASHMTFSPCTRDQAFLNDFFHNRFSHVSWERVLSGPGIAMAYQAIGGQILAPQEVTQKAREGDSAAQRVMHIFSESLGHYASNLALTVLARGGIFLGGNLLQKNRDLLDTRRFLKAFTDKGRYEAFLADIPVALITHPCPALLGAAHCLASSKG